MDDFGAGYSSFNSLKDLPFLAKCGCDMIQGYYFAKPMPASDYETRMNEKE